MYQPNAVDRKKLLANIGSEAWHHIVFHMELVLKKELYDIKDRNIIFNILESILANPELYEEFNKHLAGDELYSYLFSPSVEGYHESHAKIFSELKERSRSPSPVLSKRDEAKEEVLDNIPVRPLAVKSQSNISADSAIEQQTDHVETVDGACVGRQIRFSA